VGILYISHVLDEIFSVADRVTVLRDGKILLSTEIKNTNKNTLVQAMLGRQLSDETKEMEGSVTSKALGEVALECRGLSRAGFFQDVSFQVHHGEIVCITGLIGAKRTELLRTIFGAEPPDSGEVLINNQVVDIHRPLDAIKKGIGLVPEDRRRDGLLMNLSVNSNLVLANLPKVTRFGLLIRELFKQLGQEQIDRIGIVPPRLEIPARNLSGGNQQKLLIGRWLVSSTGILILDEPTVGVDVGAKAEIYKILYNLASEGTAILIVSSDMEEVMTFSERILVMAHGNLVANFTKGEVNQEQILTAAAER
jgi:ABC-type sugar transport system ATPase subunit